MLKVTVFESSLFHQFDIPCLNREDARKALHELLEEARRCGDNRPGWQIAQVFSA